MTTLTVALLSSVMAVDVQAPRPNPNRPTPPLPGCWTAWDCVGDSVYCYEGSPNYCDYGSGIGSLCEDDSGCGWLGYGSSARQMRCRLAWRRADVGVQSPRPRADVGVQAPRPRADVGVQAPRPRADVGIQVPNPKPPTHGYCYDPESTNRGRRLSEETDSNDSLDEEKDSNDIQDSKAQDDDSKDDVAQIPWGMSTDDSSNDTDDDDRRRARAKAQDDEDRTVYDRRRQGATVQAPNPIGNTQCRDAFDCDGVSVYCYAGPVGGRNYCEYGDGVFSICRNQAGCGYIGRGNNARKLYCEFRGSGFGGRCQDPWERRGN